MNSAVKGSFVVVDTNGRESPPVTEAELRELARKGFIAPTTEIWNQETGRLFRAGENPELADLLAQAGRTAPSVLPEHTLMPPAAFRPQKPPDRYAVRVPPVASSSVGEGTAGRPRRPGLIVAGIAIAAFVVLFLVSFDVFVYHHITVRDEAAKNSSGGVDRGGYESISANLHEGMSQDEVRDIAGEPDAVTGDGTNTGGTSFWNYHLKDGGMRLLFDQTGRFSYAQKTQ